MKKLLLTLCLLAASLFVFVGCGGGNGGDGGDTPPSDDTKYTITWKDENGTTLSQATVNEGDTPSYTYSVTDTAEWDYTFIGWSETIGGNALSAIPSATKDATYYAKVSAVKQRYTVTFNSNGGSSVASQSVEYGGYATLPEAPTYSGHKFVGWSTSKSNHTPVDFEKAITGNVEYFATWNEVTDVKALLSALLSGYKLNPLSYIPESMQKSYSKNLVGASSIPSDYSSAVSISSIPYGFGEQWHMVLDNLTQSETFFNVLTVVDTLSTASITAFNNYFDKNPADTAHHSFASGIYSVTIDFDGETIAYVLDYTANIPLLGTQTVQIALAMDVSSGEKIVRVQIGDANALKYVVTENSYEFAIKYAGVRRAAFSIARDKNGNVTGSINEHLGALSVEISSAADFYITDDYVSVVGNKASGMVGFTGYISELYDVKNGKMIGYEVQEKLSVIVYNTLWFNLNDISGINSIRYRAESGSDKAAFFVNGSSNAWEPMKKALTRRFDIEFRTQYVYSYDTSTGEYTEHEIQVPMIFVQEDVLDSFAADVKTQNGITVSLLVSTSDLNKLLSDYDTLIPVFIENKGKITSDIIVVYIGNKFTF